MLHTTNDVVRDIIIRHYLGILYFQNIIRFHRTRVNVISLTPT